MKYDCIVVGAGISGIVAASLLQNIGKKVLLIEKEQRAGGYFSGFENDEGDKFDYAISYILSCGEGDVVNDYLKQIGLENKIQFHKLLYTDDVYMTGRHICFSQGKEAFKCLLYNEFPENINEIDHLMSWLTDYQEGIASQGANAMKFFVANFKKNYEDFLNEYISNEGLRGLLSLRIQADPSSLMIMAGFVVECYFKGMFYPIGGSYKMVSDLVSDFVEKGGEFKTSIEIVKMNSLDGKIVSVVDTKGNSYEADAFVFNGDVTKLYTRFLDNGVKDTTYNRLRDRVVGHSSLNIYLTVEDYCLDAFKGGRVYLSESDRIFDTYREVEAGEIPKHPVIKLHFPCQYDSSLTKNGRQIIRIETDIFYDESKDIEDKYHKYAEEILDKVERIILPGVSKKIVYKRIITPVEFAKMFGHTNGSGTGWAHTTLNMMISKYPQNTEFSNLFIAGQWGEFGSGIRQLVLSGKKAAEAVAKIV